MWPHFLATHAFLVLAVALIGTTITPYMQFYVASAVVDKGIKPADYPRRADRHGERRDLERRHQHLHHHRHGGGDRRDRSAAVRPRRRPRRSSRSWVRPPRSCSGSGCSARPCWPHRLYHFPPRTRSPTRPGHHARCRRASARHRCSTASSRCRSSSAPAIALAPGNLVALVVNAQVLNGIITPMLLTYVLILANRKRVLGDGRQRAGSSGSSRRCVSPSSECCPSSCSF